MLTNGASVSDVIGYLKNDCSVAGSGSPGGSGDGNPKTPMGPFSSDDASAYGPPSDDQQTTDQQNNSSNGGAIYVHRTWETDKSTISTFNTADGKITGFILEPAGPSTTQANQDRRIPAGIYSPFPHIHKSLHAEWGLYNDDVPKSRYILLHIGNAPINTEGCLLPGFNMRTDYVWPSGPAIDALNRYIDSYHGNVQIIIYDPKNP